MADTTQRKCDLPSAVLVPGPTFTVVLDILFDSAMVGYGHKRALRQAASQAGDSFNYKRRAILVFFAECPFTSGAGLAAI